MLPRSYHHRTGWQALALQRSHPHRTGCWVARPVPVPLHHHQTDWQQQRLALRRSCHHRTGCWVARPVLVRVHLHRTGWQQLALVWLRHQRTGCSSLGLELPHHR